MIWNPDIVPWLIWVFPAIGAILSMVLAKAGRTARGVIVVIFSFLGWLMAAFMIPDLFTSNLSYLDKQSFWFSLPFGTGIHVGMLVDALSIILANIVAFLGLLILVYSLKYVEDDPNSGRYWFLMSLFMSGMLLLVMADNFILFFIGWKIVGLCSFALIGYYYSDEKEHWTGGPSPTPFWKPSRAGLKALLVTSVGDISLLAGIIVIYLYSGTFNFMELLNTAQVAGSGWLVTMAANPGILALTAILILGGPLAKSAQFPFQEWLPEAMAGPTPVSALIHAATMVKAGVYLVARVLPIFFVGYWMLNLPEASVFFILVAVIGGFTLFLGASQALVAQELKKALAYSTMSTIGYMMLALGVSGLTPGTLAEGMSAGIFFLINHGIFKAALFLCAGIIIHISGSIYMPDMKLSRRKMNLTWLFMWIAALSLIGFPPLSGFWSKDAVLLTCWQSGQYGLFAVSLITVILTALYTVRLMGMIFNKKQTLEKDDDHKKRTSSLMLAPLGLLSACTVAIGLAGPWVNTFLSDVFKRYVTESLGLVSVTNAVTTTGSNTIFLEIMIALASTAMVAIGMVPAYRLFISHKADAENLLSKHSGLRRIHQFLWNRWYFEAFYNAAFVKTALAMKEGAVHFVENPLDRLLNVEVPAFFAGVHRTAKKVQTGILSVNLLYFLLLIAAILIILRTLGVL
jgi:NADH-quinone oxidoreductase subunit L